MQRKPHPEALRSYINGVRGRSLPVSPRSLQGCWQATSLQSPILCQIQPLQGKHTKFYRCYKTVEYLQHKIHLRRLELLPTQPTSVLTLLSEDILPLRSKALHWETHDEEVALPSFKPPTAALTAVPQRSFCCTAVQNAFPA